MGGVRNLYSRSFCELSLSLFDGQSHHSLNSLYILPRTGIESRMSAHCHVHEIRVLGDTLTKVFLFKSDITLFELKSDSVMHVVLESYLMVLKLAERSELGELFRVQVGEVCIVFVLQVRGDDSQIDFELRLFRLDKKRQLSEEQIPNLTTENLLFYQSLK